ncbi:uncharacterized protein METZ01_LOCUS414537 [marine metagenome]|uniref:Uncharacterized protein n=1 Tax=marine metagenome TaxID=408172 RepID=A0A382WSM3_9ZZZZ
MEEAPEVLLKGQKEDLRAVDPVLVAPMVVAPMVVAQ